MSINGTTADTEAHRVYRELKREILGGSFRPGQALAEGELSRRFGASRTPLREALLRLEADGLVRIEPRRGAFVQALTVNDFLEINELRSVLEPYAARVATRKVDPSRVQELRVRLNAIAVNDPVEDDYRRLEELDGLVHAAIAEATGNGRLCRLIRGLDDMMEVMRVGDMRSRHRELHDSLGHILDALGTGDADLAETLIRGHINDFRAAIVGAQG